MARKYLRGLQYTTGTNGRDIPIFMKLCYEFWGYCVNGFNPVLTITQASNANPINITTSNPHGLVSNQIVGVYGVQGNTNANGGWLVTVTGTNTFNLNGATGNANFTTSPNAIVMVPGAIPPNGTSVPAGFFEGASVLAAGNDGSTSALGATLTTSASIPFTSAMIGKHVVIWSNGSSTLITPASNGLTLPQGTINVNSTTNFPSSGTIYVATSTGTQVVAYTNLTPTSFTGCTGGTGLMSTNGGVTSGSISTDDAIYRILAVNSNTQIVLSPFSGGTPDISTQKNNITSRSNLNYKVIDLIAASQLAVANGNYLVGTMFGPANVNSGQSISQFQFFLRGAANAFGLFGILGSPTATWNNISAFVSPGGASATITERTTATGNTFNGTTSGAIGVATLIADQDFFIGHIRSPNSNTTTGHYFNIITPTRLYSQAQDPNPMAILVGANNLTTAVATDSLSTAFFMVGTDGTTRANQLMTKNFAGDGVTGTAYTIGPNLSGILAIQNRLGQAIISDAIISTVATAGQYCLTRGRLRTIAFTSSVFPSFHLFGNNGEFIHVGNGILWPWDGSLLPYGLLPLGT
jgi:hypothetical protein